MPPKMMKRNAVKKMVKKRIAEAIEEYEKTKGNPSNVGGSRPANTGGTVNVQGCSHKTFINGKPHPFNGMKGVFGLRRWIEKVEQVFEICKCSEEDKVIFAASTFEGRALTWWNGNCPATEIQRMEQELWTLTLKGDDIEAYNNRFHELALMCPDLVPNEKKKVKRILQEQVPKARNHQTEGAHARTYMVVENPQQNPNVVTGTFLLNDHYASVLFDSGAERSFMSTEFTPFIDIASATLNTSYEVELAEGKVVSTNIVLCGCTLALFNHVFKIELLPTRLGSFDVIVGMDWLSYHRVVIVCYERIVRIPLLNGEILEVQGERPEKDPRSLLCIKADEKKLDDIRIVCDFPEVFPNDLAGLPPVREIEFCIDLIPGAFPVVKSPYRLAPSEMMELSNQLKDLQEKGFIRPSHSPCEAPVLFFKKKDDA
ncbi:putative reverse transcriptase domain-containing protein [Tanacetum coccineum]